MFENPMPEDTDAQAAELDFENQSVPAEQEPAPPEPAAPDYQPPAPAYEEQYAEPQQVEQGPSEQEIWDALEEIAEEQGPLQAAAIMSQLQIAPLAEQMQQEMSQQIGPVVEEYHERQAEGFAEALRQEYGADAIESVKAQLAEHLASDPGFYADERSGQVRFDRIQMTVDSLLARGGLPIDPDELTKLTIDPAEGSGQRDQFGVQTGNGPRTGIAQRPDGRYIDTASGRVLSQHELRQLARGTPVPGTRRTTAFTEGGSSPPPPAPPPMTPEDQVKAEIDATQGGNRDAFGRIRPLAR
jgi:hypothetical protein